MKKSVSVWWVNQGRTLNHESTSGHLWAPSTNKDGRSIPHWIRITELKQGDIVLHYAKGFLQYVSKVIEPAISSFVPHPAAYEQWDFGLKKGLLVKAEYHKLKPSIRLIGFADQLMVLNMENGPINYRGGVKQGYLFPFSLDALKIIINSDLRVTWPVFIDL